ncbi:MAG: response regulator [Dehalococcoidia bacterium]|nr:response regulator [Dehalococcoidia bacterium]
MNGEQVKILVVDDDESVRSLLQRVLKEAGYDVVTAANGREALDKVNELKVDLVLLDIKMPDMSGMEVLQQLTTNWPQTCVIMATAVADAQTAIEAMKLGAYDYITKPFSRDEMVLTVQRAIEKRRLRLENEHHRFELERRIGEQTERLQTQFAELVSTLAREHKLISREAKSQRRGAQELMSKLPPELREPMSSVEEFSDALLRILRGGTGRWPRTSTNDDKGAKQ